MMRPLPTGSGYIQPMLKEPEPIKSKTSSGLDLPGEIMNIQVDKKLINKSMKGLLLVASLAKMAAFEDGYYAGHRDARQAAAELVLRKEGE